MVTEEGSTRSGERDGLSRRATLPVRRTVGRSPRYERRRQARGGGRRKSIAWNDSAAAAVLEAMHAHGENREMEVAAAAADVLKSQRSVAAFVSKLSACSTEEKGLARDILGARASQVATFSSASHSP